jgi:hypothetical protein
MLPYLGFADGLPQLQNKLGVRTLKPEAIELSDYVRNRVVVRLRKFAETVFTSGYYLLVLGDLSP